MKLKISLTELFIVTGIIAILLAVLLPAVNAVRKDYGGWTDPIPTRPPNEDNRIYDSRGFSMVIPPEWRLTEGIDNDAIAQIEATSGYRYASTISAKLAHSRIKVTNYPDRWELGDLTLQSWQREYEGKEFGSRWFVFQSALHDGDRLFLLSFETHADVEGLPQIAADYLRTFRIETEGSANHRMQRSGGGNVFTNGNSTPAAR